MNTGDEVAVSDSVYVCPKVVQGGLKVVWLFGTGGGVGVPQDRLAMLCSGEALVVSSERPGRGRVCWSCWVEIGVPNEGESFDNAPKGISVCPNRGVA